MLTPELLSDAEFLSPVKSTIYVSRAMSLMWLCVRRHIAMQAPGLESVPTPELLSDAEILSSIKSTMTRKQTMSLPLHLLKGNPSLDALENALRAESTLLFPRAQSMRKRMVPGSQVNQPGHPFTPCIL